MLNLIYFTTVLPSKRKSLCNFRLLIPLMRKTISSLIGNSQKYGIRTRILHSVALMGILLTILTGILNIVGGLPSQSWLFPFASVLVFGAIYLYSLQKNKLTLVYRLTFSYIIFVFFPFMWITNNGAEGGFHNFIYLFLLILIITAPDKKNRIIFTLLLMMMIIALLILEYFRPEIFIYYESKEQWLFDIIVSIVLSISVMYLTLSLFINIYNRSIKEQQIQNSLLKDRNQEIQTQKDEILKTGQLLKQTNNELKAHADFKERIIHTIIHDLKSPLGAVISMSENELVTESGRSMLNLVNNILDTQRLKDSKLNLSIELTEFSPLLQEAISQNQWLQKEKSIHIRYETAYEYFLLIDKLLITRVLQNLLHNALKFSPEKSEIIIETEEKDNRLKISFTDFGPGVDARIKDNLFELYDKPMQKTSNEYGYSSGIGLSFCKLATEAHEGIIGYNDLPGSGSIFFFTVPLSHKNALDTPFII